MDVSISDCRKDLLNTRIFVLTSNSPFIIWVDSMKSVTLPSSSAKITFVGEWRAPSEKSVFLVTMVTSPPRCSWKSITSAISILQTRSESIKTISSSSQWLIKSVTPIKASRRVVYSLFAWGLSYAVINGGRILTPPLLRDRSQSFPVPI